MQLARLGCAESQVALGPGPGLPFGPFLVTRLRQQLCVFRAAVSRFVRVLAVVFCDRADPTGKGETSKERFQ